MRLILMILAIAALALPALAQTPYNARGTWYIAWNGIAFAKLWIAVQENAQDYELTAAYKNRGIVSLFDKSKSLTRSHGVRVGGGIQVLEYAYDNEVRDKSTHLTFDRAGELIRRQVVPEDDPDHRPPVPSAAVKGAATPGNLLFALREAARRAKDLPNPTFSFRFYDGKRLMQINGEILGPRRYEIDGRAYDTLRLVVSRRLLGGFTQKEIARYHEGEPPLYLYVDDATLFPLAMEIEVKLGTLRAEWDAESDNAQNE